MKINKCRVCDTEMNINKFRTKKSKNSVYVVNTCIKCENEQQRTRNATPERKLYMKEKHQSDLYKQKQIEYRKTDKYIDRKLKYTASEHHKELRKKYDQTEKRKNYQIEYRKLDYVQLRIKTHQEKQEVKDGRKEYYQTEKGIIARARAKKNWSESDKRMIDLLQKQYDIHKDLITPELIELKRITLKTTRLCLQLKS